MRVSQVIRQYTFFSLLLTGVFCTPSFLHAQTLPTENNKKSLEQHLKQQEKELKNARNEVERKESALKKLKNDLTTIDQDISSAKQAEWKYIGKKDSTENALRNEAQKIGKAKITEISFTNDTLQHVKKRHLKSAPEFKDGITSYFNNENDIESLISRASKFEWKEMENIPLLMMRGKLLDLTVIYNNKRQ